MFLCFGLIFIFLPEFANAGDRRNNLDNAQLLTEFNFYELTGGVILIKAALNDAHDSLNFILDTGSGAMSLDSLTAVEMGLKSEPSGVRVRGIAGSREATISRNNSLNFKNLKVEGLNFYINNYLLLTSVYGIRIDGVIGYTFISRYILSIDYDRKIIRVYSKGLFSYPPKSYIMRPTISNIPYDRYFLKDEKGVNARLYFDIGAGLSLMLSRRFVEDSGFFKKRRKPVQINVQGSGGKQSLAVTITQKVSIGPFSFRKVPTDIYDDDANLFSYPLLGGLIGNDLLRRFNIILDYENNIIAIRPNTHYKDLFDYSYSGMNMYMEMDGSIVIDDIIPKGPADKSGLKNGDIVIAIDRDFSMHITSYLDAIRHAGKRVEFLVKRDGRIMTIWMKVKRIK